MISYRVMILLAAAFSMLPMMVSCGQKEEAAQTQVAATNVPTNFVGVEKQLAGKLFEMWEQKRHVPTVDQAAEILGITATDSVRAEMLKLFTENLSMHERLMRYRAPIFILTNEEKLIAQYIVVNEKKNQEFPTLDKIATDLKMSPERIKDRLVFLSKLGMFYDLGAPDEYNKLGFSYGSSFSDFTFDLGLHQHVFRVKGGKPFNVGCAKEALFEVAASIPKGRVEYRTYDPVSVEPIDIVFEDGEISSVTPESTLLLEGGTCGTNNLYVSEANARVAASTMPQFQNVEPPIQSVKARYEDAKTQAAAAAAAKPN